MSKDYCGFSNEDGETAFLAGVVDVLSDNLSMILDNTNALDADIFLVVDNSISLLNDAVKKRLHAYKDKYGIVKKCAVREYPKSEIDRYQAA